MHGVRSLHLSHMAWKSWFPLNRIYPDLLIGNRWSWYISTLFQYAGERPRTNANHKPDSPRTPIPPLKTSRWGRQLSMVEQLTSWRHLPVIALPESFSCMIWWSFLTFEFLHQRPPMRFNYAVQTAECIPSRKAMSHWSLREHKTRCLANYFAPVPDFNQGERPCSSRKIYKVRTEHPVKLKTWQLAKFC